VGRNEEEAVAPVWPGAVPVREAEQPAAATSRRASSPVKPREILMLEIHYARFAANGYPH
jgi:hypothetical protein